MKTKIIEELGHSAKHLDDEIKKTLALAIGEPKLLIGKAELLEAQIVELTSTRKVAEILEFCDSVDDFEKKMSEAMKIELYDSLMTTTLKSLVIEKWGRS